jgi:probable phosphoglycerate mutase
VSDPARHAAGAVRLVLVRHGRSTANVAHVLDSRPPGAPLDEQGLAQAQQLAARLADRPVRAVYASHAVRTQQTAAPVAAAHGLPVQVVDDVHEIFLGDLEARSDTAAFAAFEEVYTAWWRGDLGARMPGGESALELRERYLPALARLVDGVGAADGTVGDVVLVSHGAAIRLAAAALLGETAETFYIPNAGLVVLRREPSSVGDGWVLESWDRADPVRGDVTAGGTPA